MTVRWKTFSRCRTKSPKASPAHSTTLRGPRDAGGRSRGLRPVPALNPRTYAPEELRTGVAVLEVVTQRAPHFTEAWGGWPMCAASCTCTCLRGARGQRRPSRRGSRARTGAGRTEQRRARGTMLRRAALRPLRNRRSVPSAPAPGTGSGDGRRYISWLLRLTGRLAASLEAGAHLPPRRTGSDVGQSGGPGTNGNRTGGRGSAGLRGSDRARSADELPDLQPAAGARLPGRLARGGPPAGTGDDASAARVPGHDSVRARQARPVSGEPGRLPQPIRGAGGDHRRRGRGPPGLRGAPGPGRGSLSGRRPGTPGSGGQ